MTFGGDIACLFVARESIHKVFGGEEYFSNNYEETRKKYNIGLQICIDFIVNR